MAKVNDYSNVQPKVEPLICIRPPQDELSPSNPAKKIPFIIEARPDGPTVARKVLVNPAFGILTHLL